MRSPQAAREPRGGTAPFGLIAATGLLGLALGGIFQFVRDGVDVAARERGQARLEVKARETAQRLSALLAGATVLDESAPDAQDGLRFRPAPGLHADAGAAAPLHELRLELEDGERADGLDDDGDGSVDERRLVLRRDLGGARASEVIICRGVAALLEGELANGLDDNGNGAVDEPGFHVAPDGRVTRFALTLQCAGPGGGVVRSHVEAQARTRTP